MLRTAVVVAIASVGCGGGGGDRPFEVHEVPGASRSLWVFGADDVWVGGSRVLHFDGAAWTETPIPVAGTTTRFWGLAPDDLWAVVDGPARDVVMRWDGASWTLVHEIVDDRVTLTAVWASAATDVWIAGSAGLDGIAWHGDGSTWTQPVLGVRTRIEDLWGSSSDDVWAIGAPLGDRAGVSRWDGTAWTAVPTIETGGSSFVAGWGSARDDVWLVEGLGGTWTHYDGGWTSEARPYSAKDIWGFAADDIWAVDSPAGNSGIGYVIHFDGTTWAARALPAGTADVHGIHGSSATDVWLLGSDRVLRLDP